jgi:hypothetical protein
MAPIGLMNSGCARTTISNRCNQTERRMRSRLLPSYTSFINRTEQAHGTLLRVACFQTPRGMAMEAELDPAPARSAASSGGGGTVRGALGGHGPRIPDGVRAQGATRPGAWAVAVAG